MPNDNIHYSDTMATNASFTPANACGFSDMY